MQYVRVVQQVNMKRLMIFMAALAIAVAKPELYKEKEDFQFSRSSTDEGSKSGFYGAQRGNMGGNYERAHNMDALAQNQMSGLVRQVEGELGNGAKTRTGSVYTAANSRGTYGSGHYDLSNLAGRNFQEGTSYGDSHSQSSLASSSAYNAAGYSSSQSHNSRHSGYQAGGHSGYQAGGHTGINLQSDDLQTLDTTRGAGQYEYGGRQTGYSSGYNARSGYQQHSTYDSSNSNLQSGDYGSNVHTRLISATPVRIIVRPGTRVAIPIGAQTYEIAQGSQVNHNSLNSEAEVLSNANQHAVYRPSNAKHYESSYNYRKEWEKHDTIPVTVASSTSTDNPFPRNSELYEDSQARTSNAQYDARRADSHRAHSSSVYGGYGAVKSTSGQSRSNYDAQSSGHSTYNNVNGFTAAGSNYQDSTSNSRSNGYNGQTQYNAGRYGAAVDSNSLTQAAHNTGIHNADLNSQVETLDTKPKSYQSSYSYHKSWERQGDPYVIKPASGAYYDGQTSQRLSSSLNQGYGSGSHYQHSHQRGEDCDENGHIRVARSYNIDQFQDQQQQSQKLEDLGQQVEDFGQLVDNFDQQTGQQEEDLGQQTQTAWGQETGQETQNLWDNVEDLSQQSHNQWDNMQQTWSKFEDIGQQTQDLNKQTSNFDQKVQNDQEQRRQGTELKHNTQEQQTHDIWDMSNIRQDDQEQSSIFDQNHEQVQFSGHDIQSGYQNTQQSNSQHTNANFYNSHKEESSFHETHHESNQWHMYSASNSRDRTVNTNINSHTIDSNTPTAPLASIWDKLGNLEPTLLVNKLNKTEENNFSQTQNNHGYSMRTDSHPKVDKNVQDLVHHKEEKEMSVNKSNGTRNEHETSHDVGRGDISSEDLIASNPDKHPVDTSESMETTQNKKEVEIDSPQSDLSVLGPVVQKLHDQGNSNDKTAGQSNIHVFDENKHLTEQSHDLKEQKTIENSDQIRVHSDEFKNNEDKVITESQNNRRNKPQQKPVQHIGQEENLYQQNLEDFSQHQTMEQQNSQDIFQQHNLDQQNWQDFGQQQNLNQENLQDFDQHVNMEQHNLQDFAQHENMDQHNSQDFSQQHNIEEQSLQEFGQQADTQLQNVDDLKHKENLDQQNIRDFGQQTDSQQQSLHNVWQQADLQQQSVHDLGHKENLDQQNEQDFGQQTDSQQQSLHNIWQQADLQQQNVHDLEQKENLDQQNEQDFGQQTDSQQQNLHNIWQLADLQQQNVHDLEQKENLDQQNEQDFGQQTDSQQQSLHNIWQQADLQQQNVHDLEQKENLDQQNEQDFGQQTDSQQQSLHNIWQQADLQQQNVHDYGQDLEVESINHNGRSNNYRETQEQDITMPTHKQSSINSPPPKEVEEVVQVKHNYDLHSTSSSTTVVTPVEPTEEKPGFWKSIGNKFKNAKNKIASWF
uniref:SFRICE_022589 n=1 Tax=Spodoptera frugiperda TaxID=7108 RepID=A0A2H1VYR7_SPOFR